MTDDVSPPVSEEVLDTAVEDAVEESNKEAVVEYDSEISFSSDIWPVIEKYTLNAHGGKGGVVLESYNDIMEYVTPGNPEESILYKR